MKTKPIPLQEPQARYTPVAIALHWLLALALAGAFGVGLYMSDLELSPLRIRLFNWHKWAGISILLLSALRLLWRVSHRPPALSAAIVRNMPAWQTKAYAATHLLMYLLFFAVPLLGWAFSNAAGFSIVWFGVLPLPDLVEKNKALADALHDAHSFAAWALAALVGLHVLAALKHQFLDRDGLLERMRPASKKN